MKPTQVSIFDVNLGEDIDSIVRDNITAITKRNKEAIDSAIEDNKKLDCAKSNKVKQRAIIKNTITNVYEELLQARTRGISMSTKNILAITQPHITSAIALFPKLRSFLKERGDEFRLITFKRSGETHLQLEPFNLSSQS